MVSRQECNTYTQASKRKEYKAASRITELHRGRIELSWEIQSAYCNVPKGPVQMNWDLIHSLQHSLWRTHCRSTKRLRFLGSLQDFTLEKLSPPLCNGRLFDSKSLSNILRTLFCYEIVNPNARMQTRTRIFANTLSLKRLQVLSIMKHVFNYWCTKFFFLYQNLFRFKRLWHRVIQLSERLMSCYL